MEGITEEEKANLNQITEILYAADVSLTFLCQLRPSATHYAKRFLSKWIALADSQGLEGAEGEEEGDMLADEELPEEETF